MTIEISFCRKCGRDFDSDCTDLGSYNCPRCEKRPIGDYRPIIEKIVKKMEEDNEAKRKAARN